ncbi:hypothetical protein CPB84DRAFT_1780143 [Gymnopilus junonius]|uniref:Protein kinase domain-containing protein n=1 Tax=Gymnopilus junonius TaxID=109634 RepID=A0A9P5TLQ2_GYMJU|nr:hypothetical protein CPB84DRAFT_1780143 [Gymnopilus junonius]
MSVWLVFTLCGVLSLLAAMHLQQKFRTLKLDSSWERLIWTWRLNRSGYSFPQVMDDWINEEFEPSKQEAIMNTWDFLRPFFTTRGYTLYKRRNLVLTPETFPKPTALQSYPYARRVASDSALTIHMISTRVWGARDKSGRDVIIKLVSEASTPSDELKALRFLNNKEMRSDPRNHTIPMLELLKFDNFIFAVMPKWDYAVVPDFSMVSELMEFAKAMLEVLEFLHEHHIAHGDLISQNIGMNVLYTRHDFPKGLRNPGEVRYAVYDFDNTLLFPSNVEKENIQVTRSIVFEFGPNPSGPYNPFKADVLQLGMTLQTRIRHIEDTVPEIGPFFDYMLDSDEAKRPTARDAHMRFLEIYRGLSSAQLEAEVTYHLWKNGKRIRKRNLLAT